VRGYHRGRGAGLFPRCILTVVQLLYQRDRAIRLSVSLGNVPPISAIHSRTPPGVDAGPKPFLETPFSLPIRATRRFPA
jgi:hypothetical protein